jgi:hypothetical protein
MAQIRNGLTQTKNGQIVYVIIAGLLVLLNGLGLLWITDIKTDVRDLRQNYFNAITSVSTLTAEVANLKVTITDLKSEIVVLKMQLQDKKKP